MIKQIAHVCINSRELQETERYYCQALGLRKRFEFQKQGKTVGFYLEVGVGTFIEVFEAEPPTTAGALKHVCMEVRDIDTVRSALLEKG
jgi:catechol 2,3-dioxygenase-like lactoylglutathione lyase family enzyme